MSDLKQYTVNVEVTDAIMHDAKSTVKTRFSLAVLAEDEIGAGALATDFYSRSGFASKMINGLFTLVRSGYSSQPGAIRTVKAYNIVESVEPPVREVAEEYAVPFAPLLELSLVVASIAPDMEISPDGTLISAAALLKEQKSRLDGYTAEANTEVLKASTKAEKKAAAKAAKAQKAVDTLTENLDTQETSTEQFVMEEASAGRVEGTADEQQASE